MFSLFKKKTLKQTSLTQLYRHPIVLENTEDFNLVGISSGSFISYKAVSADNETAICLSNRPGRLNFLGFSLKNIFNDYNLITIGLKFDESVVNITPIVLDKNTSLSIITIGTATVFGPENKRVVSICFQPIDFKKSFEVIIKSDRYIKLSVISNIEEYCLGK